MATPALIPYRPRPLQAKFHREARRFSVAVCHRRFGKTVMAVNHLLQVIVKRAEKGMQRPQGAYIAPTFRQAKRVAWAFVRQYAANLPEVKFNEQELRCDFVINGQPCRIYLLGAEDPDSIRGIYLDCVVLDEYADMNIRLYDEVVSPALADREGWVLWIGTPKGANNFKKTHDQAASLFAAGSPDWYTMLFRASETGILSEAELARLRTTMSEDLYMQELECSWSAAIKGAYWASQIEQLEKQKHIAQFPHDEGRPVHTAWDLGMSDSTAIWFFQTVGQLIHIIDYYEAEGEGLRHYAMLLDRRPYLYGRHIVPHDVRVRELGTGKSRLELLRSMGLKNLTVAPKLMVQDGIEAARLLLPKCRFDADACRAGLDKLQRYSRQYDDARGLFKNRPEHDETSHAADAFRTLAVGYKPGQFEEKPKTDRYARKQASQHHGRTWMSA